MYRIRILPLLLGLVAMSANGQSVVNANMVNATPAVSRDEGGINSCGINFMVTSLIEGNPAVLYDFSVNVYSSYMALVKAGSHDIKYLGKGKGWDLEKMSTRVPAPKSLWIATRDDSASIRPEKYMSTESKGFVVGGGEIESAMKLLHAAASGAPLQASFEYQDERIHRVFGFRANMTQDDRDTVQDCFNALIKRMKAEIPE